MNRALQVYWKHLIILFISCCQVYDCSGQQKDSSLIIEYTLPPYAMQVEKIDTLLARQAPSWITRTIIQDKDGIIWMATFDGVIKFDGRSFHHVTRKISSARFFSLLQDSNGDFWFTSIGSGIYRFDGESFQNFTTEDGLVNDRVTNIYEDKAGNLWIGTEGGISVYDGKYFKNFTVREGLTHNDVNTIIEDQSGTFWIGTRGTACLYHQGTSTFEEIKNGPLQSFENVRHIIEDKKGNIWLAGNDGLWRCHNNAFKNFSTAFVGYVYEDSKGNIWTSEAGQFNNWVITSYPSATSLAHVSPGKEIIAQQTMLFGILEDREGNIWYGSLHGVYRYDGNSVIHYINALQ